MKKFLAESHAVHAAIFDYGGTLVEVVKSWKEVKPAACVKIP